jgi:hypothetical protein
VSEFLTGVVVGLAPAASYGAWWFFRAKRFTDRVMIVGAESGAVELARIKRRRGTPLAPIDVAAGMIR